ncbi:MAG: 50S ribosomal protein L31, partial [Clostridia bacterium]|nr:50S ribosomal protein L31 [Clostridia bacterium]
MIKKACKRNTIMLIYFLRFNRHCIRERGETAMKENIHPQYGKCVVRCVCGETFET